MPWYPNRFQKRWESFWKKHKFRATNLRQFSKLDNAALNGSAGEPKSGLDGAKRSRIFTRLRQDGAKYGEDAIHLSQCGTKSGRCGTKLSRDGTRLHQEATRLKQDATKLSQDGENLGRDSARRSQDGTKGIQRWSIDAQAKIGLSPGWPKRGAKVEKRWKFKKI